jgi:hypothetical protein
MGVRVSWAWAWAWEFVGRGGEDWGVGRKIEELWWKVAVAFYQPEREAGV